MRWNLFPPHISPHQAAYGCKDANQLLKGKFTVPIIASLAEYVNQYRHLRRALHLTLSIYADVWMKLTDPVYRKKWGAKF